MKILHLITDHQVIERTLGVYEEVFPGCNEVLVFSVDGNFKRLKNDYKGKIVNYGNMKEIVKHYNFSDITHVIAHYMSMDKIDFIKMLPPNIHVCWEVYGYDLYHQFLEPIGYNFFYINPLKYERHGFLRKNFKTLFNLLATLKGYKHRFTFQKNKQFKYITNRIDSIQFCCGYDAEYIKELSHRDIQSYEIFNYSLNEVLGDLRGTDFSKGEDILVGNSASFSNNHLYALDFLKTIEISPITKIIIPLSYGGTKEYADDVEGAYKNYYSGQVETLRSYIPLHDYNHNFLRIKAMFLPAWRQEQQGTAIMGFYFGVKVFMAERNPLYKWFVDCGFIVFPIEKVTSADLNTPLTLEEKIKNRNLVEERYNEERIKELFKKNIK